MYVFASHIHFRRCMNWCSPASGSSLFPSCSLSRRRSCGLTWSADIIVSRKEPWLGESQRQALTSHLSGLMYWLAHLEVQKRVKQWYFSNSTIGPDCVISLTYPSGVTLMLGRSLYADPPASYLYFGSSLHVIFSGTRFKGTHSLEQHTGFLYWPSMSLTSLDYYAGFFIHVFLLCSTYDLVHFLPKCELLRIVLYIWVCTRW